MDREEIVARLRQDEVALRQRGVAHAALFGPQARGEQGSDSDTDIMIGIGPHAPVGVWEYTRIKAYIASPSEGPVDASNLMRRLRQSTPSDHAWEESLR
jgi:predicted nucleotidyltransferase